METVGIKRAQLTSYKKIINNGSLEDLRTNSVRKILAEEKKSEAKQVNEDQPKEVGNSMMNEIEKDGQNENEDINLVYFVEGKKKFYVPHHTHHNLTDKFSKEILMAENMLLRIRLKNEMGKRIEELELNEIILKAKNSKLENENTKLNEQIKRLEEENKKLREMKREQF